MSNNKLSPGPWHCNIDDWDDWTVWNAKRDTIADIESSQADLRAIVAVPVLLEAAENYLCLVKLMSPAIFTEVGLKTRDDVIQELTALLDRIKGEPEAEK